MATEDLERNYRMALEVTVQWLQQYQITGNRRSREAALACAQIARERFEALQQHREVARVLFQPLEVFLAPSNELTGLLEDARASIAECQAVLEHWPDTDSDSDFGRIGLGDGDDPIRSGQGVHRHHARPQRPARGGDHSQQSHQRRPR